MIAAFCAWLAATPASIAIQSIAWVVPAVQTLHILLVAVVASAILLLDLRLLGLGAPDALPSLWRALPGLALTGAVLVVAEPARELLNPAFQAKMALLAVACALTLWTQRRLAQGGLARPARHAAAIASLALWVAIVTAGRWIAYATDI